MDQKCILHLQFFNYGNRQTFLVFKYPERLRQVEFPTLVYRRNRGDMIVTYKLLSGLYDEQVTLQLDMATIGQHYTRGNSRKLDVDLTYESIVSLTELLTRGIAYRIM